MLSKIMNKPSQLDLPPAQSVSSISTTTSKTSILLFEIHHINEEKKSKPTGKTSLKSLTPTDESNEIYDCLMNDDGSSVFIGNRSTCPRVCAFQCLFQYLVDGREETVFDGYDKFANDHFKSVVYILNLLVWAVNCTTHRYPGDLIAYGFSRHRVRLDLIF